MNVSGRLWVVLYVVSQFMGHMSSNNYAAHHAAQLIQQSTQQNSTLLIRAGAIQSMRIAWRCARGR
jgi:hypothetical protein